MHGQCTASASDRLASTRGVHEAVDAVIAWTGHTACALQSALRLTNEAFAAQLGIHVRTVASWHQRPEMSPKAAMQQILDVALEQASHAEKRRFNELTNSGTDESTLVDAEHKVSADPNVGASLEWLDRHAGWTPGTARRRVVERLAISDVAELNERRLRRAQVKLAEVAEALSGYYGTREGYGSFRGTCGSNLINTTILTQPGWLDLDIPLAIDTDRLQLAQNTDDLPKLDDFGAQHAVTRLAEAVAIETRIYDLPLYRLLSIDIGHGRLAGTVNMNSFMQFALTLDLLEGELVDTVASAKPTTPGNMPLRDRYLPNVESVIDISHRLCAGGALALFAIARPAAVDHPADYLLLVQERSSHVLNSARRLSLTQGFHQPMIDYRMETRIALTLMRELEEEMFGREELDNTVSDSRRADPMHPSRLTRPMRWLTKEPARLRMEATGFGLNLVNGNYEFANLIVAEDDRFWGKYGGYIEANWEAGGLRRYSTQDEELIADLINDPMWTNEGVFALLLGLRRLARLDPDRVTMPDVGWALG